MASNSKSKETVNLPAELPPDIMTRLLAADGPTLRIIFDNAITAWKTEDESIQKNFKGIDAEYVKDITDTEKEIKRLEDQIAQYRHAIVHAESIREKNKNAYDDECARLDEKRVFIENMRSVCASKMNGFD